MSYWHSNEPLALLISKLDQQRQNRGHKGFKALTDYTEQRDQCTTRDVFFLALLPLVLVRRYHSDSTSSLYPFILTLLLLQG